MREIIGEGIAEGLSDVMVAMVVKVDVFEYGEGATLYGCDVFYIDIITFCICFAQLYTYCRIVAHCCRSSSPCSYPIELQCQMNKKERLQ